jgi:hypothetical protein
LLWEGAVFPLGLDKSSKTYNEGNDNYSCIIWFKPALKDEIIYYRFRASYENTEDDDDFKISLDGINSIDLSKYD